MKTPVLWGLLVLALTLSAPPPASAAPAPAATAVYQPLPKPGKKIPLGAGHYFIYGLDKPPKLGMRRDERRKRGGTGGARPVAAL